MGNLTPVVKNLLIINLLLWLAGITFVHYSIDLNTYLGLHYWSANSFNPVQFITYMFMHANFMHLFFNMLGLYMFGVVLEQVLGPKKFLFYYFVTGIGAAIVQELTWTINILPVIEQVNTALSHGASANLIEQKNMFLNQFVTIGASGAVFGLLLAFGMLFPEQPVFLIFLPIPIKAKYFVPIYALIELVLGVGNFSFDNIAHFAHLGGMLFGFFVLLYWKKRK